MDHLPYPEDPAYSHLRVPYLVRNVYDDVFEEAGFNRYPEALGIDRENLTYEQYDANVLDPFLQEWVFFGLLSTVFGLRSIDIDHKRFIRRDDPSTLSTIPLLEYLDKWSKIGVSKENKLEERRVLFESISVAADALSNLSSSITWNQNIVHPSDQETLYISYVILRETLQWMATDNEVLSTRKSRAEEKQEADKDMADYLAFANNENVHELEIPLLKARLDASSWCPNHIDSICYNATLM
ncbi:hypothetical protein ABVK25_010690 [Lepraria finkii]|uniref:Uncharacterized protein n=1 Tax=Lepraria finkii TaxID=1340010 RepID=A0ABR4ATI6_9LECA